MSTLASIMRASVFRQYFHELLFFRVEFLLNASASDSLQNCEFLFYDVVAFFWRRSIQSIRQRSTTFFDNISRNLANGTCQSSDRCLFRCHCVWLLQWAEIWAVWRPTILANKCEKIVRAPLFLRLCLASLESPVASEGVVHERESNWKPFLDASIVID